MDFSTKPLSWTHWKSPPTRKTSRKTRKSRKVKKSCEYPSTFNGLEAWTKRMFEQLGWMVLANERGYTDKITNYMSSLERLREKLTCKIKTVKDKDKKEDLKILLFNVDRLIIHAEKDFFF